MDQPTPAQDRPSDHGLMTLGRGLGLDSASPNAGSTSSSSGPSPSSPSASPPHQPKTSATPSASSTSPPSALTSSKLSKTNGFASHRPQAGKRPGVIVDGSAGPLTAHQPAAAAAPHGSSSPSGATSPSSSSYTRRIPSSPLSKSVLEQEGPRFGAAGLVHSPAPVSGSTGTSPTFHPSPSFATPPTSSQAGPSHPKPLSSSRARPTSLPPPSANNRSKIPTQPLKSPCFVHGNLGHSVTLQDWLERRPASASSSGPEAKANDEIKVEVETDRKGKSIAIAEEEEDDEDGQGEESGQEVESLTRQLAETAVGVREMSKQLGRTRVRSNIQSILIITKARDNRLIKLTRELAIFLMGKQRPGHGENRRGHTVYVDAQLRTSKRFDAAGIKADHPEFFVPVVRRRSSSSASVNTLNGSGFGSDASGSSQGGEGQLRYWTSDMCAKSPHLFDFVVTLGGDGTVLFTSWLFQKIVPPVLPFALGSLGFLTNFDFANYASVMSSAIDNGIRVNLRMRFTCTVYRAIRPEDNEKGLKAVRKVGGEILMSEVGTAGWEALEGGLMNATGEKCKEARRDKEKEIMCFSTRPVETFEVLNDLVVDRGPSPYVSMLELFGDEHHMTTVQADGLTISTPTGSTAYSLSAGGSLVHPEIPAILITPICPHTLSFRPMLLPDSMELRICVPYNSRSTAWASFDGRGRVELKQGDHIKVTASQYPFPTVCADKQSTDWFQAIQRTLRWNDREKQKSFVFVEEPRKQPAPNPLRPPRSADDGQSDTEKEMGPVAAEEPEEEEEETFDIDDSSTAAPSAMNSPPQTPASQAAVEPTFQQGLDSAMESHARNGESLSTSSSSAELHQSGIQTPGRFAHPPPHPAKLNFRHIVGALSTLDSSSEQSRRRQHHPPSKPPNLKRRNSTPAPLVVPQPNENEEGQRDDIHDPMAQRASKSKIPKSSDREATEGLSPGQHSANSSEAARTPRPQEKMRRHGSPRHNHSRQSSRPSSRAGGSSMAGQQRERGLSVDAEGGTSGRAFAFFGQDESDSGLSESDEY